MNLLRCAPVLMAALFLIQADAARAFDLEQTAWNASNIVVVTQGDSLDGNCTVFESWEGGLKYGDTLMLPALKLLASPAHRPILSGPTGGTPRATANSTRLVVFLDRLPSKPEDGTAQEGKNLQDKVIWIEHGKAYVPAPDANSESLVLNPLDAAGLTNQPSNGVTELQLKLFVYDEIEQKGGLEKAAKIENLDQRRQAFGLLTHSKFKLVREAAQAELSKIPDVATTPRPAPAPTVLPAIEFNNVKLGTVILSLARRAGLSVEFSPNVTARDSGAEPAIADRLVTARWENTSPRQALNQLLETNGLAMLPGRPGRPATIVSRNQRATGGNGTNSPSGKTTE